MSGVGLFSRALSIEAAEKALAEAEATLARWSAESEAKAAELSHLQAHAGDDVLADADAAGRIATDMQRLGAEQDVARRAVLAATPRVEAARRALLGARAGELRSRVSKLRRVVESRQRRTEALLAELAEHEGGATYHAWSPDCQYGGTLASMYSGSVAYRIPLSVAIGQRADLLEARAAELEQLAESGAGDLVAARVGEPMPEPHVLDREFAGVR